MKKISLILMVCFIIFNYGCESFITPTRPVYPMPFSMARGNQWEYINETSERYFLLVLDSVEVDKQPGAMVMKYHGFESEIIYWVWNSECKTLFEYDSKMQPRFALGYSGNGHTIQWGLCRSVLLDNNCLPYLNSGQCHTHLNCREHLLIVSATNDSGNVITDPQIGFFWRFDCGWLVDWEVR